MTSQSTRRVAIVAAIHTHHLLNGTNGTYWGDPEYGDGFYSMIIVGAVAILMSAILVGVCLLMKQKQKRIQEAVTLHNMPWVQNLEVFTLNGPEQMTGVYLPPSTPSPPPAYESVVKIPPKDDDEPKNDKEAEGLRLQNEEKSEKMSHEADDLPTYESAMKLDKEHI